MIQGSQDSLPGKRGREPVLLIHGFSASILMQWGVPGILDRLASNHQVIAFDCRGHGKSDKPHDPSMYGANLAEDAIRLLDHLGVKKAHVVGYSMGGRVPPA
ncbi:MAG: alpha/beta fold hydrolase [Planctomycetota bacterium]